MNRDQFFKAVECYMVAVDNGIDQPMQPSFALSTASKNGTVTLRNIRGFLAMVTVKGNVYDRVGGPAMFREMSDRDLAEYVIASPMVDDKAEIDAVNVCQRIEKIIEKINELDCIYVEVTSREKLREATQ